MDFYNEHDEPLGEPASGSQEPHVHAPLIPGGAPDYGGYDAPGSNESDTAADDEEEADAGAVVAAAPSDSEPGPEEPTATDLDEAVSLLAPDAPRPVNASTLPDVASEVALLADQWHSFLRRDAMSLPCLTAAQRRACMDWPAEGSVAGRHIFIDGAFYKGSDRHRGGWAAVAVIEWSTPWGPCFAFEGYAGGPLIEFTKRPLQAEYSSYDAEAAAMLVVLTWHLAVPEMPHTTIHFDANAGG